MRLAREERAIDYSRDENEGAYRSREGEEPACLYCSHPGSELRLLTEGE